MTNFSFGDLAVWSSLLYWPVHRGNNACVSNTVQTASWSQLSRMVAVNYQSTLKLPYLYINCMTEYIQFFVFSDEEDITTEVALRQKEKDFKQINDKYLKSIKMAGGLQFWIGTLTRFYLFYFISHTCTRRSPPPNNVPRRTSLLKVHCIIRPPLYSSQFATSQG